MNWITYASFGLTLMIVGFNAAMFLIIKFNDMKHMDIKLDSVVNTLKEMDRKLDRNSERVAKIEGTCAARKECK